MSQGSIPARAGEPYSNNAFAISDVVYPRACGGTFVRPHRPASL